MTRYNFIVYVYCVIALLCVIFSISQLIFISYIFNFISVVCIIEIIGMIFTYLNFKNNDFDYFPEFVKYMKEIYKLPIFCLFGFIVGMTFFFKWYIFSALFFSMILIQIFVYKYIEEIDV